MDRKGEFGRIRDYFAPLALDGGFGLSDDAGVLTVSRGRQIVVTTDTLVAGVHYVGDERAEDVAAKLLRVNLSDLAAMGADPVAYTLNLALPVEIDDAWVELFTHGLREEHAIFEFGLLGGDSVSTPGPATLTATLFGEVPTGQALRRAGASPGDKVYVSGTIGDGTLGLMAMQGAFEGMASWHRKMLTERYLWPEPRIWLGRALRGKASAAADVSDGLVADLGHIAEASGVGAVIEAAMVPMSEAGRAALSLSDDDPALRAKVLTGGDDYELVFTGPDALESRLRSVGTQVTCIGEVVAGAGVRLLDDDGEPLDVGTGGYVHG